ncbi:MAG: hypothetical protein QOH49_5171 [Acidobacteriota bacterium]|jgi:hypothetical protein|nr:hypothetical protein [Acidobacteriota bacterium]
MKKLAGLLAFAVALAGAILLTQYYSRRYAPPPPPPPAAPAPPVTGSGVAKLPPPTSTYTDARGNVPVSFKTQLATLDLAAGKGHLTLALERDPARPAPATVWVWAYFFTPDAPGRYCAGEPVEVRQPFASAPGRAEVKVELPVRGCPAPRTPSSTYYTRANISTESAFAARLTEQRISYDVSQASPVVVEGKQK